MFRFALQWRGVLIEASPTNFKKLVENRPDEIALVNEAVCATPTNLHFVDSPKQGIGEVSGFLEFSTKSFQQKWYTKTDIENALLIPCRPLHAILQDEKYSIGTTATTTISTTTTKKTKTNPTYFFDFFSLDVEGAEYAVLTSLDFNVVEFGVVLVECDSHNPLKNIAIKMLLQANGYTYHQATDQNWWFVNDSFHTIYSGILPA